MHGYVVEAQIYYPMHIVEHTVASIVLRALNIDQTIST